MNEPQIRIFTDCHVAADITLDGGGEYLGPDISEVSRVVADFTDDVSEQPLSNGSARNFDSPETKPTETPPVMRD